MPAYLAPGVYLRPQRTDAADVRLVRTDVAGFLGFTERGPVALPDMAPDGTRLKPDDRAIRLTSWDEYRAVFGGLIPHGFLPFAVRGFFENGGRTCYVMRVTAITPETPAATRPRVSRWVFRGDRPPLASGRLLQPARKDDTALASDLAGRLAAGEVRSATAVVMEIAPADGGVPETHPLVGADGDGLLVSGRLGRGYPAGAIVTLHQAALEIEALSPGNWGNRIRLQVTPLQPGPQVVDFALRVTLDRGPDASHPHEEEFYRLLSVEPRDDARRATGRAAARERRGNPAFAPDLINGRSRVIRVVYPSGRDDGGDGPRVAPVPLRADRVGAGTPGIRMEGGQDGLTGLSGGVGGVVPAGWLASLDVLDAIDEVSILCAPDLVFQPAVRIPAPTPPRPAPCAPPSADEPPPDVIAEDPTARTPALDGDAAFGLWAAMLEQCERRRDRVTIVDPPASARQVRDLLNWRSLVSALPSSARRFGATYGPWLQVPDPTQAPGSRRALPPSGHVAGVYAQVDNLFGVHRPPANVALAGVLDVVDAYTTPDQEALNPRGINLLRTFPGRGIRVWGARSLSDEPDWRFIHARRLVSMIEESVDHSMQWAVFEPNDDSLRRTVVHALSVFLREIWQKGGLQGNTPAEGFFVRCDETNNPPAVVDAGQIVCQVGVAVAAPMEFIVFEIRQTREGADVVEQ